MTPMDPPTRRYGPPDGAYVLWGGPADGQALTVDRCVHGDLPDVEVPMRSRTLPGVIPDETWHPQIAVARYSYNDQTQRYEYVRTDYPA